jgi:hypothetical protein
MMGGPLACGYDMGLNFSRLKLCNYLRNTRIGLEFRDSREHGNENSEPVKGREFID